MSRLRRRDLLRHASLLGAAAALPLPLVGCESDDEVSPEPEPRTVFLHGVASGDPLPDAVILWTRVSSAAEPVTVSWEIASDAQMSDVVGGGEVSTDESRDYTVKLDAQGLGAGTTYYYRFSALGEISPVGRTRTAPAGAVSRLRFGVASCANYAYGYFNAYRHLAARIDLDAVLFLGDYIYEYGDDEYGMARALEPAHECVSLEDYRLRYAVNRTDPDLQAVHQQLPFVAVWDDHETADNSYSGGAENHQPEDGPWEARKAAGLQAYLEWLPIREQADGKLQRSLRYGDLVDLIVLDARIWGRDAQAADGDDPILADDTRTILGMDQEQWLADELMASTARWKLVAQQVMMGQLPQYLNPDAWDGYPFSRQRLFDLLRDQGIDDVVVLTGDIHSSWAMDLTYDPFDPAYDPTTGAGSLAVEMVCPGISSPGFPEQLAGIVDGLLEDNPHLKWAELVSRGYVVLDVDEARVQAAWYLVDTIETRESVENVGGVVAVYTGQNHLVLEDTPAAPPSDVAPPAPADG